MELLFTLSLHLLLDSQPVIIPQTPRHTCVSSFAQFSVPLFTPLSEVRLHKLPFVSVPLLPCSPLSAKSVCITLSPPASMALFKGSQCHLLFPVSFLMGSLPPSVYAVVLGRPDHRPDVGFLEVSVADFLALPAQALPPFSSLGRARSTLDCPSLF